MYMRWRRRTETTLPWCVLCYYLYFRNFPAFFPVSISIYPPDYQAVMGSPCPPYLLLLFDCPSTAPHNPPSLYAV